MQLGSRRTFLQHTLFSAGILLMPQNRIFGAVSPASTLGKVLQDLFPNTQNVPTIKANNALPYLQQILHNPHVTAATRQFIRNGIQWLNEEAVMLFNRTYIQLNTQERQTVLVSITTQSWGESWMHTLLGFTVEAMLGDPVYGINRGEAGWKWLNHTAGLPRPKKAYM